MAKESELQSLSISGGQLSNVQIGGIAGSDQTLNQSQIIGQDASENTLTSSDVRPA